jgi:glycosyltransferase involved in cell wall biosynthesis
MKILMVSHAFHPQVGGLETVSMILASGFVKKGHEVVVVTQSPCHDAAEYPFRVVRRPGGVELFKLVRWCEVFFHNNISLNMAWPLLFIRRPWVVAHHTWIARLSGWRGVKGRLKLALLRYARCISISEAIAAQLYGPSEIIPNPYDDRCFRIDCSAERDKDLVYVGRLVSDKGVDLLLGAISRLKKLGLQPQLTIVGDGPDRQVLERQAMESGISDQIHFVGCKDKVEVAYLLNQHRILVVPSRWNEPFGVVALEGIACGCVAVGSSGGGLQDAIGECGGIFENGDTEGLTRLLRRLLQDDGLMQTYRDNAERHLERHKEEYVVVQYLRVLAAS